MINPEYSVLKIYASTTDKVGSKLLYEHIVLLAKDYDIAGVTVLRGIMGFGQSSKHISSSKFWELTDKLPVVIEIVDKTETIENFYLQIEKEITQTSKGCLITIEPVRVMLHKKGCK